MTVSIVRKLWRLLVPAQRRGLLLLFGPMFLGMVLEALGIGLIVPVIALFTQPDYAERIPQIRTLLELLGNPSHSVVVVGAMLTLILVYLFKAMFLAFLVWRQTKFAYGVQAELSQRLFATYLQRSYIFHVQHNSAQLLRNLTSEVSAMVNSALLPGMLLAAESLVLLGVLALLLSVEPIGALVVAIALGIAAICFHSLTRRRIAHWGRTRQVQEGLRIQHLQQGLGGVKDIKLLDAEREFAERYRPHNFASAHVAHLQSTLQQWPRLWLEVLAVSGLAILVLVMLAQNIALESVLPTLALFAAAAFRLLPSANRVIGGIQALRYGRPAIETLHDELYATHAIDEPPQALREVFLAGSIQLEQVSFTYPNASAPALREVSCHINRGETVGFIGTSGAGKSTLIDVLLGLMTPERGRITVDGVDISKNMLGWRRQIGYVPQMIFLTDDSLLRNVAFGVRDRDIDEAAVWRALEAAQLAEFVRALPGGLQTAMGERGARLSGGQRQRIGIARALYRDPPVLFLDEATSSLDTNTERGVMQAVMSLHGAKTIIIVAHRLSTVECCDRLYRLERGQVVEQGSPSSMLRVGGSP